MAIEAITISGPGEVKGTTTAALASGQLVQLPDGRAAAYVGLKAAAVGDYVTLKTDGIVKMLKTVDIALLEGGDVFWDVSANKTHFRPETGTPDFYAGTCHQDAAAAATTVYVNLNNRAHYTIDMNRGDNPDWVVGSVAGTTATTVNLPGGVGQINILATNEAQGAAIVSSHGVPASAKPIFEARLTQVAASGATVDMDWGLATGSHASDFETVASFAAFHTDGGDANIDTHSDDVTTDRALADSTIDLTQSVYDEYWIDARDDTNVKFYVNGVLVDTSASKRILTAALTSSFKAIAMVEKTTGAETAELRVSRMRVRTKSAA